MMKALSLFRLLSCLLVLAPSLPAQEGAPADADGEEEAADPSHLSPNGRFTFRAFTTEEVRRGMPAFGILENHTGALVSDPDESFGDASRPEETILWAPDSMRYALTTRVGTRHLDTLFYAWDGRSFRRLNWEGNAALEARVDERMRAEKVREGFSADLGLGQVLAGDSLPERWLDPWRLVLKRTEERIASENGNEAVLSTEARAILRWVPGISGFEIERELPSVPPWPQALEEAPEGYEVRQETPGGDDSTARHLTVTPADRAVAPLTFTADGWMLAPTVLTPHEEGGWPQIELHTHGPSEIIWRKLYRVTAGAYRCVRVDELSRQAHQAPEGAPQVELEPGFPLHVIRSREAGGQASSLEDGMETFFDEIPSPARSHKVVLTYSPQYLAKVELSATSGGNPESRVLYDFESGEGSVDTVCQVLWRPDGKAFALYTTEGPRVGRTQLFRLQGQPGAEDWESGELPALDYDFTKPLRGEGEEWEDQFEQPLWWTPAGELVLELRGRFSGGAGDYRALATLGWNADGTPREPTIREQSPEADRGL